MTLRKLLELNILDWTVEYWEAFAFFFIGFSICFTVIFFIIIMAREVIRAKEILEE